MTLTAPDMTLAGAIITASMTFWAIYMALYVFVFQYFRTKPEPERYKRGGAYFRFFIRVELLSLETVLAVVLSLVALVSENELVLILATGLFMATLFVGTISVVREIRTTQDYVLPYFMPEYIIRNATKKYLKQLRKKSKEMTTREASEKFVQDTLEDFLKSISDAEAKKEKKE